MHQHPGEDLDAYMKIFYEKALDCCDLVAGNGLDEFTFIL